MARRPSKYAEGLLVELLISVGFSPQRFHSLLLAEGHAQLDGVFTLSAASRLALQDMVGEVSRRGMLTGELLDAIEVEMPERGDDFAQVRVELELSQPPHALVSSQTLADMKRAAQRAQLHKRLIRARLNARLPRDVRRRAAQVFNDDADTVASWFDVANRQVIGPGDEVWMLQLLDKAIELAEEPGRTELAYHRDQLQLTSFGGDARAGQALSTGGNLEKIVNKFGIALDGGQFYERMGQALGRICIIRIAGHDLGTGFLVDDDKVLTNHHVLAQVLAGTSEPGHVSFTFDYRTRDGQISEGPSAGLLLEGKSKDNPQPWLIDASPNADLADERDITKPISERYLDFALVRIHTPMGQTERPDGGRRGHYRIGSVGPEFAFPKGSALIIVGHPAAGPNATRCSPQVFAIEPDAVVGINSNRTRVRYRTNTMRGSSGSPVLSASWEVVALHHFGVAYRYNQGIPIAAIAKRDLVRTALAK